MATPFTSFLFIIFTLNFFFGFQVHAVPYDYSYTLECLAKPKAAQYNGGIVVNPEFNDGLKGWTAAGGGRIEKADGNNYAVARTHGLSQSLKMEKEKIYTVSAWVQVSKGKAKVEASLQTASGKQTGNWIMAQSGCWKMIKGGFILNSTALAHLHLQVQTNDTGVDVWVDSVSVQPFSEQEWKSQQDDSRDKARKTKVRFKALDEKGQPIANATVSIRQRQPNFPIGTAVNRMIVGNSTYQKWFLDRFRYTVFESELNWSETEKFQGQEKYATADAMLEFCKSNDVKVRGHSILWEDAKYQPEWVPKLPPEQLREAAQKRVDSVVSKYKGQFIHWDVINENFHRNLFGKLNDSETFDAAVFNLTHQLDPFPILFLNDFNTIEGNGVYNAAAPSNYLDKIQDLRTKGYNGPLGIGLEGHFYSSPNIAYIRASIDMLASTGLPIWITEFDVNLTKVPNPLGNLELLLREFHSHAGIGGIMFWSAMSPEGECQAMCLTDKDYTNTPAGDVVDKFMSEFIRGGDSNGTTDDGGVMEATLFHGEYEANVTLSNGIQSTIFQTFNVVAGDGNATTVELRSNT